MDNKNTNITFLETICIHNGTLLNTERHLSRMRQTAQHFGFSAPILPSLQTLLPEHLRNKKVKCRIVYNKRIEEITFEEYTPRNISSLKLIEKTSLDYRFKFSDRKPLQELVSLKHPCDEILITQNGCITDTSYSNVVFRKENIFFTPDTYLLNGTKRQKLLQHGRIIEQRITTENIRTFETIYLINALLDIEDAVSLPCENIIW